MSNDAVRVEQLEVELRLLRNAHAAEVASLRGEIEHLRQGHVTLVDEIDRRNRALTEALEQQAATTELLRIIASSPTNLSDVLQTIAERILVLCDAYSANVGRFDGELLHLGGYAGGSEARLAANRRAYPRRLAPEHSLLSRATVSRKIVH